MQLSISINIGRNGGTKGDFNGREGASSQFQCTSSSHFWRAAAATPRQDIKIDGRLLCWCEEDGLVIMERMPRHARHRRS